MVCDIVECAAGICVVRTDVYHLLLPNSTDTCPTGQANTVIV